jgi:hypothetical protein
VDVASQIVPAVVILAANLLSGKHGSLRYEAVTAGFGWTAGVSLIAFLPTALLAHGSPAAHYLFQVFVFSLLTALSRDYERILRPLFR